jgi:hypothetical protein
VAKAVSVVTASKDGDGVRGKGDERVIRVWKIQDGMRLATTSLILLKLPNPSPWQLKMGTHAEHSLLVAGCGAPDVNVA